MKKVLVLSILLWGALGYAQHNATLAPNGKQQFFDKNGKPVNGGLLYTYAAGTTTPQATYTDSTASTANANPIVLDSGGFAPSGIWLKSLYYKFVLQTAQGVTIWTLDNISGVGGGSGSSSPPAFSIQASDGNGGLTSDSSININPTLHNLTAEGLNQRFNIGSYAGASVSAQFDAAVSQAVASGSRKVLEADPTLGTGFTTTGLASGQRFIDYRGNTLPDRHGNYNSGNASGYSNAILFNATETQTANSSSYQGFFGTEQFYTPLKGGVNNFNGSTGTKTDYATQHLLMNAATVGQRWLSFGHQDCNGGGDCIGYGVFTYNSGGYLASGDEQAEAGRFDARQETEIPTGLTISAINGNVLTYSGATNGGNLGEQRPLIIPSTAYTTGTATATIGANTLTGSGTAWQTNFGLNRIVAFCLDANAGVVSGNPNCVWANIDGETTAHFVAPTGAGMGANGVTGSSKAFCFTLVACSANWPYSATTGAYHMYKGAVVTQVSPTPNGGASGTITVADATQFSVGQVAEELTAYNGTLRSIRALCTPDLVAQSQNGWAGYCVDVQAGNGAQMNALLNLSGNAYNGMLISGGSNMNYGIRMIADPVDSWLYSPLSSGTAPVLHMVNGSSQSRVLQYDRTNDWLSWFDKTGGATLWRVDGSGNVSTNGSVRALGTSVSSFSGALGKYANLLTYSQFDPANPNWPQGGGGCTMTTTANTADFNSPYNGVSVLKVVNGASGCNPGQLIQTIAGGLTTGLSYTFSIFACGAVGGEDFSLEVAVTGQAYTTSHFSLTQCTADLTGWRRYQVSFTAAGVLSPRAIPLFYSASGTYYVWGAQLEQASGAGAYIQTVASTYGPFQGLEAFGTHTLSSNTNANAALTLTQAGTNHVLDMKNGTSTVAIVDNTGISAYASQTAIASASTIAPTARFFHVTGTTAIATITPPTVCTTANTMCQITIIPDGLGSTTNAGNIALGTTFVVGKALIETYDPTTSKWYPSY